jgi:hypothetical protein
MVSQQANVRAGDSVREGQCYELATQDLQLSAAAVKAN